jgi:energy-coupling factor transporter ATP-binding protein EcfA2
MAIHWVNPKTIIGNTATGNYYYDRPNIISNIWDEIEKGNHVLLAAPRRVGKSSVMKHMVKTCPPNYKCIFNNIPGYRFRK